MPNGKIVSRDSFANGFRRISKEKSEWAGLPTPLFGERLVIEKSYTYADVQDGLNNITCPPKVEDELPAGVRQRNEWWSDRKRGYVLIWEEGGKIMHGVVPGVHHLDYDIRTLSCSEAWSLQTEMRAMETLRGLVRHHQFRQYFLTGTFLERSKRSGVMYMFRRLKPTLAISMTGERPKILAALCLHPVSYYQDSWAGAQTPSDDVLAHLMLMRGDEKLYWRRANQHSSRRPEAGV